MKRQEKEDEVVEEEEEEEAKLIREIAALRKTLSEKESNLNRLRRQRVIVQKNGLSNEEIARYSRQILIPEIGVKGQVRLKNASVLIIGAGGLGCPAALYLAGAGVGRLGIVDYDDVETNNLHRQLLFSENDVGTPKAEAAAAALTRLNNSIEVTSYKIELDSKNALEMVRGYDVVVDASDNPPTKYLLNDACVLAGKPLVSGSALKLEGQLSVFGKDGGPCYRCVFPSAPPPESVTNCGDGGVLGAAVGTIGVLQAVEVLKIILGLPVLSGHLLLFDGSTTTFRKVRLRGRNLKCAICGDNPTIERLIDYEKFCGSLANDKNPKVQLLTDLERISVRNFEDIRRQRSWAYVLVDVRSAEEFDICRLDESVNVPWSDDRKFDTKFMETKEFLEDNCINYVYVVCRRGNDSQRAVRRIQGIIDHPKVLVQDIIGGLNAWTREIDPSFPIY